MLCGFSIVGVWEGLGSGREMHGRNDQLHNSFCQEGLISRKREESPGGFLQDSSFWDDWQKAEGLFVRNGDLFEESIQRVSYSYVFNL